MNPKKRLASLLLVVALLCSLTVSALAANNDNSIAEASNSLNYVVFGSSQTNGYGLHGYVDQRFYDWTGSAEEVSNWNRANSQIEFSNSASKEDVFQALKAWNPHSRFEVSVSGYRNLVPGCYPDLIAKELENSGIDVTLHQLALSSMRPEELRVLLDDNFNGDAFTDWRFTERGKEQYKPAGSSQNWFGWDGGLEVLRKDYQATTAEADLITYDLGANNFGAYLANQMSNPNFATTDLRNIIKKEYADLFYSFREKIESGIISLAGDAISAGTFAQLDNLIDTFTYATLGYCVNFDKTMKLIYDLNPDVDMVVLSIQNNMSGINASISGLQLPLGGLMAVPINLCNVYTSTLSPYHFRYSYADVSMNMKGRVENFVDDLLKYEDIETLKKSEEYENITDALNAYDNHLFLKERVTQAMEAQGISPKSEAWNKGYDAACDVALQLLKAGASENPIDAQGALGSGSDSEINDLLRGKPVEAAVVAATNGDYSSILADALTKYDAQPSGNKAAFTIESRIDFGNSFFAHPNQNGHRQVKEIVMKALKQRTSGNLALLCAAINAQKDIAKLIVNYGVEVNKTILTKAAEIFHINDLLSKADAKLLNSTDPEALVAYIEEEADITTPEDKAKLEEVIEESAEEVMGTSSSTASGNVLTDLPKSSSWAFKGIQYCLDNGLMKGISDKLFAPWTDFSRAMLVQVLYAAEGKPEVDTSIIPFKDVDPNGWCAKAIAWAYQNGLLSGYSDDVSGADDSITRGQLMTILYKYAQMKGYDVSAQTALSKFKDSSSVPAYAKKALSWGSAESLISGLANPSGLVLQPNGTASRAQVATILMQFMKKFAA